MQPPTPAFATIYQYHAVWWPPVLSTLVAIGAGALVVFVKATKPRVFLILFCLFAGSFSWNGVESLLADHRISSQLRSNGLPQVEGYVTNFVPEPVGGHADERFEVGGVQFAYRQAIDYGGYHQTLMRGGIVHAGQYLRIAYVSSKSVGNQILRIEIDSSRSK